MPDRTLVLKGSDKSHHQQKPPINNPTSTPAPDCVPLMLMSSERTIISVSSLNAVWGSRIK